MQPQPLLKQKRNPPPTELELLTQDNQELELLGQGTYGCAFYPEITCQTHHISKTSRNFLSKIQLDDDSLQREIQVGKRIVQKLPTYRAFFAPVTESCPVQLSRLRQDKIQQCDVLKKQQSKRIVSSKIPFVSKVTLGEYFSLTKKKSSSTVEYVKKLINTYLYLLKSFNVLNTQLGIVHLDVKNDNIMSKNGRPILIDFGLSYCIDWLQYPKYLEFKYPFGIQSYSYSPWCIEICFLTEVARHVRGGVVPGAKNQHGGYADEATFQSPVPSSLLDSFKTHAQDFVDHNFPANLFSDAERKLYLTQLQAWIDALPQKSVSALWTAILSSYNTWDLYAVAMTYLEELSHSGLLRENRVELSHSGLLRSDDEQQTTFSPIRAFIRQLKTTLLAMPGKRPLAMQLFQDARAIFAKMSSSNYKTIQQTALNPKQHRKQQQQHQAVKLNIALLQNPAATTFPHP
jgi:hypothetical protein